MINTQAAGTRRKLSYGPDRAPRHDVTTHRLPLSAEVFNNSLRIERKRTERSNRPFALLLIAGPFLLDVDESLIASAFNFLSSTVRESDSFGWYSDKVIGILFTELGEGLSTEAIEKVLLAKVSRALENALGIDRFNGSFLSCRFFPEDPDTGKTTGRTNDILYSDLTVEKNHDRGPRLVKRGLDVLLSLIGLIILAPVFLCIALAIKLTSQGPVLFRQERVGYRGNRFRMLKFRSMKVANDSSVHQEFVKNLISGKKSADSAGSGSAYKLTRDTRITPVGNFLRKTSLDELPQLINVLRGQMSLVGPRPPLPYEVACYRLWHLNRLFAARPGITGLWQILGRSRVTFDEMVRMDLEYATSWSVWLDLKILAQTPWAVFRGTGAH